MIINPIQVATKLDLEFQNHCRELNEDRPWFGELILTREGKSSTYRITKEIKAEKRPLTDKLRIIHWCRY